MKQVILDVLEDVSQGQVNLESEAAREMVANLLIASIKSKGCYTEYGDDNKLDTAGMPIKKIDKWLTQDIDETVMIDEYKDIVDDLDESDMEKKMIWEDSIKEEQEAIDSWVCEICNKSTYDVEYDYIGSGTNHLNCELKQESQEIEEIEMKEST